MIDGWWYEIQVESSSRFVFSNQDCLRFFFPKGWHRPWCIWSCLACLWFKDCWRRWGNKRSPLYWWLWPQQLLGFEVLGLGIWILDTRSFGTFAWIGLFCFWLVFVAFGACLAFVGCLACAAYLAFVNFGFWLLWLSFFTFYLDYRIFVLFDEDIVEEYSRIRKKNSNHEQE